MNYQDKLEKVLDNLKTTKFGLTEEEANLRLTRYGKNELPRNKQDGILKIFLRQILDPIVIILLVTIIFSIAIGEIFDAFAVIFIVLVDLVMGTIQEYKASKKAMGLANIIKVKCQVLRDFEVCIIDSSSLVVGDIVFLESGNKISADIRLIEANHLTVNESVLTGESLSCAKEVCDISEEVSLGDRKNMLYAGCVVLIGRARGVVVATGIHTEIGKIAKSVSESKEEKSPLTIRIHKFSRIIVK